MVAIIMGLVVGAGLFMISKEKYYSASLVASTSLSDEDIFEVVKSISYSVERRDYVTIEKKMNISKSESKRLKSINIENVLVESGWDITGAATSLVKSKLFKITVDFSKSSGNDSVYNQREFLDALKNGIVNYIDQNPYIKERQHYTKIAISNMIGEIGIQLKKLDTLQKSVIEQKPQRGQVVVENANKQSFSSDILNLLERKLRLEESYQLDRPIMVVEDFNCKLVVKPRISGGKIGLIIFAFFAVALLYASFLEIKVVVSKETGK